MQKIDHQPQSWYLFEHGADLFLDCNCNVSAFGYSVLIRLTPEEAAEYRTVGRTYLSWLADQVQSTGPGGDYQKRDVQREYSDELAAAFR